MPPKKTKLSNSKASIKELEREKLNLELKELKKRREGVLKLLLTIGLPLIISLGAFALSYLAYYHTYVKKEHELQVFIMQGSMFNTLRTVKGPIVFDADWHKEWIYLSNRGNQSETIIGIHLNIGLDTLNNADDVDLKQIYGREIRTLWSTSEPMVIKPSEVIHKRMEFDLGFLDPEMNELVWRGVLGDYRLTLGVSYIDVSGNRSYVKVFLGVIKIYEEHNLLKTHVNINGATFDVFEQTEVYLDQLRKSMPGT